MLGNTEKHKDDQVQDITQTIIRIRRVAVALVVCLVLLLLLLCLSVFSVMTHADRDKKASSVALVAPQRPFMVGQSIAQGSVVISITKVDYSSGRPPFVAPENRRYALVSIDVKNVSETPIQVLPSSDIYIKSQSGAVSFLTPFMLSDPFRAGELLPGERITGQLSYLIDSATASKLFVDAIWSGGVLPFALNMQ